MRMHKTKIFITLSFWLIVMFGMVTSVYASGTVIVAVSASELNIGDSVTITATPKDDSGKSATATLTFNFDTSLFTFVSCSAGEGNYGGGAGGTVTASAAMESVSITLKAKAAGSNTVTVSGADGVSSNLEDLGALSSGGAKVTVANAASQQTDPGNALSSDSSLSSLKISPGTLSPAFKASTKSYTANVAEDITSIAVNASPKDANATIASVSGKDNLAMGNNTVKIVVKAQDGTTSTYTIVVTRGEVVEETTAEEVTEGIPVDVNGTQMSIVSELDSVELPEGFSISDYTYKDSGIQVAKNEEKGLILFYLTDPATNESAFYIYDEQRDVFYKYQTITIGSSTYIIMLADDTISVPDGYKRTTLTIGEQQIDGWISDYDQEYGLLYAMSPSGVKNLYLYNFEENTIIKVNDKLLACLDSQGVAQLKKENTDLSKTLSTRTMIGLITIAVLVVISIVLLILLVRKRKRPIYNQDELEDYMLEYAASSDRMDDISLEDYEDEEVEELDNESEELSNEEDESEITTEEEIEQNKIPKDVITEEKLKEFTKKCEEIIGGNLSVLEDSLEENATNDEKLSQLDEDFVILDSDDDD